MLGSDWLSYYYSSLYTFEKALVWTGPQSSRKDHFTFRCCRLHYCVTCLYDRYFDGFGNFFNALFRSPALRQGNEILVF